ncbi:MAG TPA: hypothetical protein VN788_16890 [Verrucomicrobiae bacterium]|nr:hypothetical protein [Verrucomicrobiae bacterium]
MELRSVRECRKIIIHPAMCLAAGMVALVLLQLFAFAGSMAAANGDSNAIHWVSVSEAQVKLDDKTPLAWNVYQTEKKNKKDKKDSNLVLVLLGHRYLLLDTHAKVVWEVPLTDLKAQGANFDSGNLTQQSRVIPSTDWSSRDVGPAEIIQLTLGDYGRVLQVSLPHPPDLRPFY